MKITRETPIFVYGFGARGRQVYETLTQYGLQVAGYIDKEAVKYRDDERYTAVYGIDQLKEMKEKLGRSVVFITITNVFEHERIAEELAQAGACYIIYKLFRNSCYADKINDLFEKTINILQTVSIEGCEAPEYERKSGRSEEKEEDGGLVCVNVPVNLLFGLTKKLYYDSLQFKETELLDYITDKSLLYFTISKNLMRQFMRPFEPETWKRYIDIYFRSRTAQTFADAEKHVPDKEEIERHLLDRYSIFQQMDRLFSENPGFFFENPISVVWNEKGYFNIEDGNNRAVFLSEKGMWKLPCRMKKQDYLAWLNQRQAVENVSLCLSRSCLRLRSPISHPMFFDLPATYESYSFQKLKSMCEFFWNKCWDPAGKRVLEMDSKNDLIGQHMARMGAHLTIAGAEEWLRLNKAVNHLLYLDDIEYIKELKELKNKTFDMVFCNSCSDENLRGMRELDFRYAVIECMDEGEEGFRSLMKQLDCGKYKVIREQLTGNRVTALIFLER